MADGVGAGPVERGFPHLATVRTALTALYRRVSYDTVAGFAASVLPVQVEIRPDADLRLATQDVARVMVRHLRLPRARIVVTFRDMVHAGSVELAAGPEYFVELNDRFTRDRRDIGACLAHEVTHVYLHRLDLWWPGTRDNEILTDTVAAFLGAGWLLLDAFREESVVRGERLVRTASKLGYLTPEEFGYVLAVRARVFGEDVEPWLSSPEARTAYREGARAAARECRTAPLAGAGWAGRRRFAAAVRRAGQELRTGGRDGVEVDGLLFQGDGAGPRRVSFACPTCHQWLRVPLGRRLRARCVLCRSEWDCET